MKLSTARKLVCMSYFMAGGIPALLATASRVVHVGDTKRFMFPDGSVLESVKGHWKVMKNPKLEAAVKRFGAPAILDHVTDEVVQARLRRHGEILFGYDSEAKPTRTIEQMQAEIAALQELLNEKDEQIDKATRPMVVRLDWWLVGLVGLVLVANGLGYM